MGRDWGHTDIKAGETKRCGRPTAHIYRAPDPTGGKADPCGPALEVFAGVDQKRRRRAGVGALGAG